MKRSVTHGWSRGADSNWVQQRPLTVVRTRADIAMAAVRESPVLLFGIKQRIPIEEPAWYGCLASDWWSGSGESQGAAAEETRE